MSDELLKPHQMKSFENPNLNNNDNLDDLFGEIDEALNASIGAHDDSIPAALQASDFGIHQMHDTMLELMRDNLNPMCRYIKALRSGENIKDLLELCEIMTSVVVKKIEEVGLKDHHEDMVFFRSLLLLALSETDQHAVDKMKDVVIEGFKQIEKRFGLNLRGYKLAVRNLVDYFRALKQNPSINNEDVRKLFSVGIPSLTWIRRTRVEELQSLCGLDASTLKEARRLAFLFQSGITMDQEEIKPKENAFVDIANTEGVFIPPEKTLSSTKIF